LALFTTFLDAAGADLRPKTVSDLQTEAPVAPVARPRWTRWRRRGAWVAGGLLALATAVALLVPLVVRGRVLRGLVARATASLCGSVTVGDGRLGWSVVPDLLLGRPATLTLERVRVGAPDGRTALAAERLTARVELHRRPWRVVLADVLLETGGWELVVPDRGPPGFVDAFRRLPRGASRAACLAPPARVPTAAKPPAGPAPSPGPPALDIRHLRLRAIDIELRFPMWGLALARVDVEGSLSIGDQLLFDARDVVARGGGVLRVGREGDASSARERFDDVAISRVAVLPGAPADLALELARAVTGRSRLAGRAVFRNIFSAPRGPRSKPPAVGIDLEAAWTEIGDALAALEASWLPAGLRHLRPQGQFEATLHGPFNALAGQLRAAAGPVRLTARLGERGDLETELRVDGADTAPLLDPSLRPLLGGRLSGRIGLRAHLAPTLQGLMVDLRQADLRLDRARPGPWPRRLTLRLESAARAPDARGGTSAQTTAPAPRATSAAAGAPAAPPLTGEGQSTLAVTLALARLEHATLRLEDLQAGWTPLLRVHGAMLIRLAGAAKIASSAAAAPTTALASTSPAPPAVTARFDITATSLERLFPGSPVRGMLKLSALVSGVPDLLTARITFAPPRTIWLWNQGFTPTAALTAALRQGDTLTVSSFGVTHEGGGRFDASGRLVFDGPLDARLRVRDYPVGQLPGLDAVALPAFLAAGRRGLTVGEALRGQLDGELALGGALARPTASAAVRLLGLRLGARAIGDGALRVRTRGDRVSFDGALGPAITFDGSARPPAAARGQAHALPTEATATVRLHDLRLAPWLPAPWAALEPAIDGELVATTRGDQPALHGALRIESTGGALQIDGRLHGAQAGGRLRGQVELARLRPLWWPGLAEARGPLELDLTTPDGALTLPSLMTRTTGEIRVAGDLTLRPAGHPAPVMIARGGALVIDGRRWRTSGLALTAERGHLRGRIDGEIRVDEAAPSQTTLALGITAQIDAALVPELAAASGGIDLGARLSGTVGRPEVDGQARVDVALRPASRALPSLRATGTVEARTGALSTRDLRVAIDGVGLLTVGSVAEPATVRLTAAWPPGIESIDLPLEARHLTFDRPAVPITVDGLDLALRLEGRPGGQLVLSGVADLDHAEYDPRRGAVPGPKRKKSGPSRWYRALPPRLTLDLTLRGPNHAMTVAIPFLPDVTVDFDCHLVATSTGASLSGQLRGAALYSRAALAVYDWTRAESVRRCQIFPQ
jgi:hypothetical protein